jgi:hypothetical protein
MEVISPDTGVTIGLLITAMGGVVWLTRIWAANKRNGEEIAQMVISIEHIEKVQSMAHEKTAKRIRDVEKQNVGVLDRMARIETKIDLLLDSIKK